MAAGALRKRIMFQVAITTDDGGGGGETEWRSVLECWGQLIVERGRERLEAGRLESALGGVLRLRSSRAARQVGESYRVLIDGVPYQIRSIANPDQRNKWLEMVVEKGVAT